MALKSWPVKLLPAEEEAEMTAFSGSETYPSLLT
jgi:hypothetical protein